MRKHSSKKLTKDELLAYALRCLSARAHSEAELVLKLKQRAQRPGDVQEVFRRLKELRLLDDRAFAQNFAEIRLQTQTFGSQRVLSDLAKKKVPRQLAEEVVEQVYRNVNEEELLHRYATRRLQPELLEKATVDPQALVKIYRKLRRAGFSHAATRKFLKELIQKPEVEDWLDSLDEEPGFDSQENEQSSF